MHIKYKTTLFMSYSLYGLPLLSGEILSVFSNYRLKDVTAPSLDGRKITGRLVLLLSVAW